MSVQDNEKKGGIFPGKVIIVEHGKIVSIEHELTGWRKNAFSTEFVLPCRQREDSASGTEALRDFPRAKGSPKPFFDGGVKAAA